MSCIVTVTTATTQLGGFGSNGGPLNAQTFTTTCAGNIDNISAVIEDGGSPSDDVQLGLYTGSPPFVQADYIASSTVSGGPYSACSGGGTEINATFDAAVTDATVYTVVFGRTGALDDTNNYSNCGLAGGGYAGGTGYTINGGVWSTSAHDYNLEISIADDTPAAAATTTNTAIMRSETISSVTLALLLAMLIYFAIKFFVPRRRQRPN